jgi:hypothetical protein
MKPIVTVFFFLFLPAVSCMSQIVIYGSVTTGKGEPVPWVNISIKGSFDGSSSDPKGYYLFKTSIKGNRILQVSCLGYHAVEKEVTIGSDSIHLDFTLTPVVTNISTVYVTAGSFEASDEKRTVILRATDIGSTAGAIGDISEAVSTLPGTQVIGESTGLFVRGGSGNETKVIIDEMVVRNPYYSPVPDIKQRGRFDPFMFSGTLFSTGGYSAQYGQALSSILVMKSKGLADSTNTGGGIHFYGGRFFHTHRLKETSIHSELNYNNMGPYHDLFRIDRYNESPENVSGKLIFRQRVSEKGIVKAYADLSATRMNVRVEDLSTGGKKTLPFELENRNCYLNLSYKEYFRDDNWSLFAGLSWSDDDDRATLDSMNISEKERLLQSKIVLTNNRLSWLTIKSGIELQQLNIDGFMNNLSGNIRDPFVAGFMESDLTFSDRIVARIGLRYEHSGCLERSDLAPRISVAVKTGRNGQLSFATGIFYQEPETEYLYYSNNRYQFEYATHYIINYQWNKNQKTFRAELFNKKYGNLLKNTPDDAVFTNDGSGYARGADLFWRDRKTIPGADYWISYSFLDTKRDYRDFPVEATPAFAAKHNLHVVYKHWLEFIHSLVGFTYTYSSGRPYYNPLRPEEEFHSDETNDYHNLNLNLSRITRLFRSRTIIYLSLCNVLGRDHIFGYNYLYDNSSRIAVKPVSKRSLFLGCFVSTY